MLNLRKWYDGKSQEWFDSNLASIVSIDAEIKQIKDRKGFSYYEIGNSKDRFYPTDTYDVIQLANGEEYYIEE